MKIVACLIAAAAIALVPTYALAHAADVSTLTFGLFVTYSGVTIFVATAIAVLTE